MRHTVLENATIIITLLEHVMQNKTNNIQQHSVNFQVTIFGILIPKISKQK